MNRRKFDDPAQAAVATFNMTPMIDVVFQLIVVFLCSMKFRTLDQKVEATLPKDVGIDPSRSVPVITPVLAVRLLRKGPDAPTQVYAAGVRIGTVEEGDAMWDRLRSTVATALAKSPDLVGEINAQPTVEHGEVVRTVDGFLAAGLDRVKFVGTRPPGKRPLQPLTER
jgi:biopolymer transport protein ExbD